MPLLKSGAPQYVDRLNEAGDRRAASSRASSVGGRVELPRPSTIAPSPPPPPSTPSRRLQLAHTRQAVGRTGQQDMQKALEQQVERLEAELRRKKKIATAASIAASATDDKDERERSARAATPAVGV